MEFKAELVRHYTGGQASSSTEMNEREISRLIAHLKGHDRGSQISQQAMVKKIIHLLCKRDTYFQTAAGKPDMTRINGFIDKKRHFKNVWKIPNDHLRKIIGVLENRF